MPTIELKPFWGRRPRLRRSLAALLGCLALAFPAPRSAHATPSEPAVTAFGPGDTLVGTAWMYQPSTYIPDGQIWFVVHRSGLAASGGSATTAGWYEALVGHDAPGHGQPPVYSVFRGELDPDAVNFDATSGGTVSFSLGAYGIATVSAYPDETGSHLLPFGRLGTGDTWTDDDGSHSWRAETYGTEAIRIRPSGTVGSERLREVPDFDTATAVLLSDGAGTVEVDLGTG